MLLCSVRVSSAFVVEVRSTASHRLYLAQDLRSVLRRTAAFLGTNIPDGKEDAVLDHLSFESMKNNPAVNLEDFVKPKNAAEDAFIRKGETGSWKKRLNEEQVARMNEWCAKWLEGKAYPHFTA